MGMNNINIAVLDRQHRFASELGKLGTKTDIAMYHYKIMDKIITFIDPVSYPDRLKPLSKTIGLSDFIMINIDKLDKITGEMILESSYSSLPGVVYSELFSRSDLIPFIKGTGLEKWRFASSKDELFEFIQKIDLNGHKVIDQISRNEEPINETKVRTEILIDQIFQVKSVGTVALGTVRRGVVKVHDNLILLPNNIKSDIRSIQVHDKDVKEAFALKNKSLYPVNVNRASWEELIKVPGIGKNKASQILKLRKEGKITSFDKLEKLKIPAKAKPWICY